MKKTELQKLEEEFGVNKRIPARYKAVVLAALSYYPELKDVHIIFRPSPNAAVPYGTKPTLASLFLPPAHRTYVITILEKAELPERDALLKNLPVPAQVGTIGHELAHVVQYHSETALGLQKLLAKYALPRYKKEIERAADIATIHHGLGDELHVQATYIRRIPGYTEKRPELNKNYLKPTEIIHYMRLGFGEGIEPGPKKAAGVKAAATGDKARRKSVVKKKKSHRSTSDSQTAGRKSGSRK
jgi:hypothetical protein